ncbi:GGDEF domain-containing protein [Streptomyces sp. NPDC054796]
MEIFEQAEPPCCPACGASPTDELTGLLDRRAWDRGASQALAHTRHGRRSLALILADLDRFKAVNDNFGHLAGDAVLRAAASVLRRSGGGQGLVGRYGGCAGDEFLILLPDTDLDSALAIARDIQRGICSLSVNVRTGRNTTVPITGQTVSMGVVAHTNLTPGDLSELLLNCDTALCKAKDRGGNQICRGDSEMAEVQPAAPQTHLVDAQQLDSGEICIAFDPCLHTAPLDAHQLIVSTDAARNLLRALSDLFTTR